MQTDHSKKKPELHPYSASFTQNQIRDFVKKSTVFYLVMLAIGYGFIRYFHNSLPLAFGIPTEPLDGLRLLAIGGLGAIVILVLNYFFEDWFASYRAQKAIVIRFLGPVSVPAALYLALLTAFSEEMLFRGAIQPGAGLVLTSILFGLLHKGQGPQLISTWAIWAFLAGFVLGWMYDATQSLWPPILAHFCVNTVSILNMRRSYRTWLALTGNAGNTRSPADHDT